MARLTNGIYRYEGQTYHLPIHGFAPTAEFTAAQKTDDAVALQIETNPELYAQYPFRFRYTICYRLEENTLHAEICVENRDEKRMYFALGGHPGINVPLEDGLRFEDYALDFGACAPQRVEFTPDCFVTGRKTPFALQNGKLPLCHALFDQDVIVLKGTTGTVTLASERGSRGVRLIAPDFPIFGCWHMPKTDAPYVCLEPWSSLPSRSGVIEDLENPAGPHLPSCRGGLSDAVVAHLFLSARKMTEKAPLTGQKNRSDKRGNL